MELYDPMGGNLEYFKILIDCNVSISTPQTHSLTPSFSYTLSLSFYNSFFLLLFLYFSCFTTSHCFSFIEIDLTKSEIITLKDPNDDNIILGIPEDIDPSTLPSDEPVRKVKIIQKHVKKSRMLLNRFNANSAPCIVLE